MKTYPGNLSKRERHMIVPLLPKRGNACRQKWKWKVILNALFYVLRTGCQCLLGQSSARLGQSGTYRACPHEDA